MVPAQGNRLADLIVRFHSDGHLVPAEDHADAVFLGMGHQKAAGLFGGLTTKIEYLPVHWGVARLDGTDKPFHRSHGAPLRVLAILSANK
jgi:hypothetical protein